MQAKGVTEEEFCRLIGRRIRDARKHAGLTIQEVVERAKISNATYHGLEVGHRNYTISTLFKVIAVLGCDTREIIQLNDVDQRVNSDPNVDLPANLYDQVAKAVLQSAEATNSVAALRSTIDGLLKAAETLSKPHTKAGPTR